MAAAGYANPGPNNQNSANQKQAYVRFVNGIPGRNDTLSIAGQKAFSNVEYGTATEYKEFRAKNSQFKLFTGTGSGNVAPVASNSQGLNAGDHYTVFSVPSQYGRPRLEFAQGNSKAPANGKAKVNVINASLESINVTAPQEQNGQKKAQQLFSGVGAASSAGYKNINPVDGTLNIERSGSAVGTGGSTANGEQQQPKHLTHVLQVPAHFQSGQEYTILVTGGTQKHPLKAQVIQDQVNTEQAQR